MFRSTAIAVKLCDTVTVPIRVEAMMEVIQTDRTPNFYFMHPPPFPPPSNFGATGHYGAAR
jgi:hypothetical protein